MTDNQSMTNLQYWVWRYSIQDNASDQLQKAVQEYIKRYQNTPYLVLVPQGLHVQSLINSLEIQQNELVPPFRYYLALYEEDNEGKNVCADVQQD